MMTTNNCDLSSADGSTLEKDHRKGADEVCGKWNLKKAGRTNRLKEENWKKDEENYENERREKQAEKNSSRNEGGGDGEEGGGGGGEKKRKRKRKGQSSSSNQNIESIIGVKPSQLLYNKRNEDDDNNDDDDDTKENQNQNQKKRSKHNWIMGTLRGRLRKARKQISWCAFPLNRRHRKSTNIDETNHEIASLYESAIDIPYRLMNSNQLKNCQQQRNQKEFGQTCRGSVNLQEARILSDKATNSIVITAASQTFHVKAHNDTERQQWLTSLELARHKAIKRAESEEDEDAQLSAADSSRSDALIFSNKQLMSKLMDLKTAVKIMNSQGDELIRTISRGDENEVHSLSERADLLKNTTAVLLQTAEEFVDMTEKTTRKLGKIVASEQKQKHMLQEQLEELAKQHSSLERAATFCSSSGVVGSSPLSAYCSDQEEEFHDAEETLNPCDSSVSSSNETTELQNINEMTSSSSEPSDEHQQSIKKLEEEGEKEKEEEEEGNLSRKSTKMNGGRCRRTTIPKRPDLPINLWSIMKNCIGKELSKIPMPVNFSEPLSVLQRVTEDLEYAYLLEEASKLSSLEQICYVAAYAASNYSTTCHRTNKPFNPLLGETFEMDRTDDLGWKSILEQVSHHPPAAAHHAEGNGWIMYQDFTMTSRFRGKFLSVIPVGYTHVLFPQSNNHYSYRKITTTVHNIIVGKLWIDNHGDMEITNHTTGEKCVLKFIPYSYFSRDTPRKVYGIVRDSKGVPAYVVQGTWDKSVDMLKVSSWNGNFEKPKVEVDETTTRRIWTVNPLPPGSEKMHNFTRFAIELNEPEEGVAPTDSRLRPDQRLMEDGKWDEANRKKLEIEEKQRIGRRKREAEIEKAMQKGEHYEEYQPTWFIKVQDEKNGALIHQYKGGYWEAKEKGDWSKCPDIF